MNEDITRRDVLKMAATSAAVCMASRANQSFAVVQSSSMKTDVWKRTNNRVWLGGEFWANPMEDWEVTDGAAECKSMGGNRSVHSLTHQITDPLKGFSMAVQITQLEINEKDGGAGFRVGVRSEINEFRSNCFVAKGLNVGFTDGKLFIGTQTAVLNKPADLKTLELCLAAVAVKENVSLTLEALTTDTRTSLGKVVHEVAAESLLGNVALVSNFGPEASTRKAGKQAQAGSRHRFSNWIMGGGAFTVRPDQRFGPILWSMYSISDSRSKDGFVLKISALTGPMGQDDNQTVELHVQKKEAWQKIAEERLDPDAWVATFRIPNWDERRTVQYKLVYREKHRDGSVTPDEWTGTILANPVGRPLRMAAMTCQNDYAFPYEPLARNVVKMKPDIVFFSGDQIYENHGGFGIIREPAVPAILCYLRKFYQFGWSFREVMRNCPTVCLPDDHDVFQANLWGEGGSKMPPGKSSDSSGGYIESARVVNAVHRTNASHHPDPFDPTPCDQDISVYYGEMVYGGVGFAIIADRQWKSGPERVNGEGERIDHVEDPNFDTKILDKDGLELLGRRQEAFLKKWSQDWRGHTLKALLSQTVFSAVATHHGKYDGYLKADLDAGGWPQTARNRAIDILRPSMSLHICGDQHLASLSQYGVDKQRDSGWAFCTPAIAAGYPRWWRPDEANMPHTNRPKHGRAHTGEYLDGFGNKVYVYAVGNPVVGKAPNRYEKAHEKGSGFGFITFNTVEKTYFIESYRFLIEPTDGKPENQFQGWPVTIHQAENRGENRIA